MRWSIALAVLLIAAPARPCLVFLVADGRHVFAGNNEDWADPRTRLWVVPAEDGRHGRLYFGYPDGFPQGGVNDAGLFFDGLALDAEAIPKSDKPAFTGHPGDIALAECSTVQEVVALFERHDRAMLARAQLFFGDKTGDAVIIEGTAMIRKKAPWLMATNFRQSETAPGPAACPRYGVASELLDGMREPSVEAARKVLDATHQEAEDPTQYSQVYDLVNGKIHLYHFHDFDNDVVLDVAAELAKGAHTVEIASLFPKSFAFEAFQRTVEASLAARREAERDRSVDPRSFEALVGRYRLAEVDGVAPGLEFRVRKDGEKLVAEFREGQPVELVPRGGDAFVCITLAERADFTFARGGDGSVSGVTLVQGGVEMRAAKVE